MSEHFFGQARKALWVAGLWLACVAGAWAQEAYKPLFSEAVLTKADPESRARLEALNERNRQRWLQQQTETGSQSGGQSQRPAAAQAQPARKPVVAANKLYRVTDSEGNVRFSDQYVKGATEVSVSVAEPSATSRAAHAARQKEQALVLEYFDDRNRRREQEAAEQQRLDAQAVDRNKRCHDLFLEIQDNRRGGFVSYDVGPNGERTYLSDDELAVRTDGMEANYRENCGELPHIGR